MLLRSINPLRGMSLPNNQLIKSKKVHCFYICFRLLFNSWLSVESTFDKFNKLDEHLVDRLKSVKVVSADATADEASQDDSKRKLPQERYGAFLPYVFYKSEQVPRGKLSVLNALDVLVNYNKGNTTINFISTNYAIPEDDIRKVIRYVDIFKAVDKNKKEMPMYSLEEEEKLQLETPKIGTNKS